MSAIQPEIPPRLRQSGPDVWHLAPEGSWTPEDGPRVLIGGVGYWWQRDASFGLAAVEALEAHRWRPGVRVAKLDYGAVHVAEDLRRVDPPYDRVLLIAGVQRGRTPARLYMRQWDSVPTDVQAVQRRVYEAGAGVVDIDHLLIIAGYFGVLPGDVRIFEVEPEQTEGGIALSPAVAALLSDVIERVRREAAGPPSVSTPS